ncbi:ATP-binding protein [Streptomyces sp. NPDC058045]|uniref:ATP-binding protein n=1 Tax=Streptomyces sp. NPDC058045 TaxID=3346311 RepID=UPI0036ED7DB3
MSHLRAPAARADRREGGRHGRPGGRSAVHLPETHIRTQLLRLALLPAVAVALCAAAAVLFTVRATPGPRGHALWAVLAGAGGIAVGGLVIAVVAAERTARTLRERVGVLRRTTARHQAELRALAEQITHGRTPRARRTPTPPRDGTPDDLDLLADELRRAQDAAVAAVVHAARRGERQPAALESGTGKDPMMEVFANLARRLQSLVHREISVLDELENDTEDPDLLKGLFHVDHLATRMRRHAENLAVLGGAVSRRQWSSPVCLTEVLRSAVAEVEQYERVRLVPPTEGTLRGHAVADVVHLLAELVENATVFSAPQTQVLLRVAPVTSGLAVEVEDRGLGMPAGEQKRMNALLAEPGRVDVARLLQDGRIGLYVVSRLAQRHGISVRLQSNIYGGIQAVLVVPEKLLGTGGEETPAAQPRSGGAEHRITASAALSDLVDARHRARPAPPGSPASLPAATTAPAYRTPANGTPVPPAAVQMTAAGATPAHGTPVGSTPAHGTPVQAQAAYGTPAYGTPAGPTPAQDTPGGPARPRLPRRRAQEHLVPQLREPAAVRAEAVQAVDEEPAVHDPGLVAAFRRGISLAETAEAPATTAPDPAAPTAEPTAPPAEAAPPGTG